MGNWKTHDIAIHRHGGTSGSDTKDKETVHEVSKKRSYGRGQITAMDRENALAGRVTMSFLVGVWLQEGKGE